MDRKLRVFLCHASQDKPIVRELYKSLAAEGWIDPWLDEEKLLPGQDWDMEIEKAVEAADAVIVCLSKSSVSKEGYVQRELKFVLDIALEKQEDTVYIIPLRLDEVQPPRRLRAWQYADYFPEERRRWAFQKLQQSLKIRFEQKHKPVDLEQPKMQNSLLSTVSIETKGKVSTPIFYKGDSLPAIKRFTFSTAEDNQTKVEIHLVLGENKTASNNLSLGKFAFDGILPARKGVSQVEIQFEISRDLKLKVLATDKNTNRSWIFDTLKLKGVTPPLIIDPLPPKSDDFSDFFRQIFESGFDTGKPQR